MSRMVKCNEEVWLRRLICEWKCVNEYFFTGMSAKKVDFFIGELPVEVAGGWSPKKSTFSTHSIDDSLLLWRAVCPTRFDFFLGFDF